MTSATGRPPSLTEIAAYAALFGYVFWFRAHGLDQAFMLSGDQIRDWTVATRQLRDLPLSGVPSVAGGTTLGPTYHWILWSIANTLGPFYDHLPHAGGVGFALLQSVADVVLAWALARRTGSLPLSLAIVILAASSVFDASLSGTIWNPVPAEALAKIAMALVLVSTSTSIVHTVAITAVAWAAVQTHTTALVASLPVMAWTALGTARQAPRRTPWHVLAAASVLLVMQVPWLVDAASAGVRGPSTFVQGADAAIRAGGHAIRIGASAAAVTGELGHLLLWPIEMPWFPLLLTAGAIALIALTRDVRLVVTGPLPILAAIAIYALWQGRYERYWMMQVGASGAMCLLAWIAGVGERWRTPLSIAALAIVVAVQPGRFALVRQTNAFPGYGALVEGCRRVAGDGRPLAALEATFPVAPGNPIWLCSILGVGLSSNGEWVATIDDTGAVTYRQR
jgi:hypothetical protein